MKIYSFNEITNKGSNIRKYYDLLQNNKLFKLSRGIYSSQEVVSDEVLICKKNKFAVITLLSAFRHYHFTNYVSDKKYICIPRDKTRINNDNVVTVYENSKLHKVGITSIRIDDFPIRIYNLERLLIELFKHQKYFSFEQYKEIIINYRKSVNKLDWQKVNLYLNFVEPKYKEFIYNKIMSEIR